MFGSLGGTRRRRNAPPKPIEVKVGKLDFTGLAQAYDWATIDIDFGLKLAFSWYDQQIPMLLALDPLDKSGQKTYDRATRTRKLGTGNTSEGERRTAWTTALHLYEKLWAEKQPKLLKVDEALAPEAKPSKAVVWQQQLFEGFKVFEPFGVHYQLSAEQERAVVPGLAIATIHLPISELAQMRGSILSSLLKEAVEVAKQTSVVDVGGTPQLDGNTFLAKLPLVLDAVAVVAGGKGAVTTPVVVKASTATSSSRADSSQQKAANAASVGVCLNDEAVIHLLDPNGISRYKGLNATRFSAIKNGMTLKEYRAAVVGKIEAKRCGSAYLRDFFVVAVKAGHVSISSPKKS
jgi:hypothetical protein